MHTHPVGNMQGKNRINQKEANPLLQRRQIGLDPWNTVSQFPLLKNGKRNVCIVTVGLHMEHRSLTLLAVLILGISGYCRGSTAN